MPAESNGPQRKSNPLIPWFKDSMPKTTTLFDEASKRSPSPNLRKEPLLNTPASHQLHSHNSFDHFDKYANYPQIFQALGVSNAWKHLMYAV